MTYFVFIERIERVMESYMWQRVSWGGGGCISVAPMSIQPPLSSTIVILQEEQEKWVTV